MCLMSHWKRYSLHYSSFFFGIVPKNLRGCGFKFVLKSNKEMKFYAILRPSNSSDFKCGVEKPLDIVKI